MHTLEPDFSAFTNEFLKLSGLTDGDAELVMKAAETTYEDAAKALQRLRELESSKPTVGEISRGALAGAAGGTAASIVNQLVSGGAQKAFQTAMKERKPGWAGMAKGMGSGALTVGRNLTGAAAGSAAFGTTLPFVRRGLDEKAEASRLKEYLGQNQSSRLRRGASEYLGV